MPAGASTAASEPGRRLRPYCLAVLLAVAACATDSEDAVNDSPRIAFLDSPSVQDDAVRQGAEMAVDEAGQAGDLIGRSIVFMTATAADAREAARAAHRLRQDGVSAIIAADDSPCRAMPGIAADLDLIFLNAGCRADGLRAAAHRNTFHIEASDAMYGDATPGTGSPPPSLWHGALTRYGAAQLNERFQKHLGASPSPGTWAAAPPWQQP